MELPITVALDQCHSQLNSPNKMKHRLKKERNSKGSTMTNLIGFQSNINGRTLFHANSCLKVGRTS